MSVATPHRTERMHVSPRSSNARGSAPCSAAPAFLRTPFQPGATSPDSERKPQPRKAEGTTIHQAVQGVWRGNLKKKKKSVAAARGQLSPRGSLRWLSGRVPGTLDGLLRDGAASGFGSHPGVLPS